MKKRNGKILGRKLLALVLTLIMCVSLLNITALAAGSEVSGEETTSGDTEPTEPKNENTEGESENKPEDENKSEGESAPENESTEPGSTEDTENPGTTPEPGDGTQPEGEDEVSDGENEIAPIANDKETGPSINRTSKGTVGPFGMYVGDEPLTLTPEWINEQLKNLYRSWALDDSGSPTKEICPDIDVSQPGWLFIEFNYTGGSDDALKIEMLKDGDTFNGLLVTANDVGSASILINYWPKDGYRPHFDNNANYTGIITIKAIPEYVNGGDGVINGTNTIPAGAEGNYFYGTEYAGYERVYVVRDGRGYPVVLNAMVPMTATEQEWKPDGKDHVTDWTADGTHNFEVAYCADSETLTSETVTGYKVAHLKDLDDRFTPEQQARLQAIIEHAYPFISAEQMLEDMKAAGFSFPNTYSEKFASALMMIGAQYAIWNITNPGEADTNVDTYEGYRALITVKDLEIVDIDGRIKDVTFKPDNCINNKTPRTGESYPAQFSKLALNAIIDYLNSCTSSIAAPVLDNVVWSYAGGTVTVTGTVSGMENGDTLMLEGQPVTVGEGGVFTASVEAAVGETVALTVGGTRTGVIEAMYFESVEYQNFIGGMLHDVPVSASVSYTVPEPETTSLTVNKTWVNNDGTTTAPEGASITVTLYQNGEATEQTVTLNADNGWSATFSDLAINDAEDTPYAYTVVETAYSGYETSYTTNEDGSITITNTQTPPPPPPVTPRYGSLTISKAVVGGGDETANKVYTFTVTGPNGYSATVTVTGSGSETLTRLTPGAYTVTEEDASIEGFIWTAEGQGDVTVLASETANVTVTNTYEPEPEPEPEYGSLTVSKAVVGGGDEAANKVYTFTVTGPEGFTATVEITGSGSETLTDLVPGVYTVTEEDASIEGFTWTVDGQGGVTVAANETAAVTVTNTYEPDIPDEDIPDNPPPQDEEPDIPDEDLPDEEPPLEDLPDEEPPLEELPDEEPPLDDVPKTGDDTAMMLWLVLAMVSGLGLALLTAQSRKGKKQN